jgi:hypothetical protein
MSAGLCVATRLRIALTLANTRREQLAYANHPTVSLYTLKAFAMIVADNVRSADSTPFFLDLSDDGC